MARAAFIYESALSQHVLRQDHPMRPARLRHTYQLLQAYRAFDDGKSQLLAPRPATLEELGLLHTSEYITAVRGLSSGLSVPDAERFGFSAGGDNPIYDGMYEAALLSTGATIMAAELVASHQVDVAFNISGGLHHAAPGHASGFCIFNDPALAIKYLLSLGLRVAYVDIDAHHGDGVQNAFIDNNQVLTISIHESGRYLFPGTGFVDETGTAPAVGYSVNLPLYPYTEDEVYLQAFQEVVPPLLAAFAPDILVTQLGIDSYHADPLTHLQVTSRGFVEAVRFFSGLALPWLALGGGGYDLGAVARCWSLAYGVMVDAEWPDTIPEELSQVLRSTQLRDTVKLEIPEDVRLEARRLAEEGVAAIKKEVFPLFGIRG